MSSEIDEAAIAAAALLFVDPRKGLDRVGKDDAVGACEFFNVYPETVGRMVSAGLLVGVTIAPWTNAIPARSWSAGRVAMRPPSAGAAPRQKEVPRRLYVPDAAAVEVAFREEMAPTWRGCVLRWPEFLRAVEHLRAAEVAFRCSRVGTLDNPALDAAVLERLP